MCKSKLCKKQSYSVTKPITEITQQSPKHD